MMYLVATLVAASFVRRQQLVAGLVAGSYGLVARLGCEVVAGVVRV